VKATLIADGTPRGRARTAGDTTGRQGTRRESDAVAATPAGGRLRNSALVASRLTPIARVAPEHVRARLSCVCPPGRFEFPLILAMQPVEGAVALTQTQLAAAVADRAQLSRADAKRALAAFDEVVLDELGNAEKVRIGGLVQLTVRVRPAQKARKGRNPATGEEITIAAKPASVDLRARPLARAKGALPSVQKARRRLAA
jgi:DNA-binding protein HU-beta